MTCPQQRLLRLQVNRKLSECLHLAECYFARSFPRPTVSYKLRGVKAGAAYLQQWEIRLNPILLSENRHAFIDEVVPHELAHLLVYHQFGRVKPHGGEWRMVMNKVFNLEAKVRHQFAVESVQGETFPYRCSCQIHHLSNRRHNKILRKGAAYFCKKCKTPLKAVKRKK